MAPFDVIIVGGGPAGLSAALILGRARRRVVVVDEGHPRNAASHALHGFLSRDGTHPRELLRIAREQVRPYDTVELLVDRVEHARREANRFEVSTRAGVELSGRRLILATGMVDELPDIPGLRELYGQSVFHCPYCDGWEVRDRPLAAHCIDAETGAGFAIKLRGWSHDVVLCLDGHAQGLGDALRERLARHGVRMREERILRLEGRDGRLERIVFEGAPPLERAALFFHGKAMPRSSLARQLGCDLGDGTGGEIDRTGKTSVPGLYVIGDASRDVLQVAVAAGEGTAAAIAVNTELIDEDFA